MWLRLPAERAGLAVPEGARAAADFDVERAVDAWVGTLPEDRRASSDAYFEGGYWLQLWGLVYGLGVAWILLRTRLSAAMRDVAGRATRRRPLQTALYAAQYILALSVMTFPLTLYQGFYREHRYDLATQTPGAWLGDRLKGLMVSIVLGTMALTALYAVLRRAPRAWWLWGAVVGTVFLVVTFTIGPVFIAPLFNDYHALDPGPLRDRVLSLARANGIAAREIYWYDASRQTTRISANVSGLFGTTRISLNDNLLRQATPAEIEAVMGHEMGHYVLNHGLSLIASFALVLLGGFVFVRWAFDRVLGRRGEAWGVRGVADPAGLPLLAALFSVYFFAMTPVTNSIIRTAETEADIFGLNAARQPDGFAAAAMKLSTYRKISPGPLEEALLFDHPSGRQRVSMAMRWKAEQPR